VSAAAGLAPRLEDVRARLRAQAGLPPEPPAPRGAPPAADGLERMTRTLGLTPFERDVLALAAGCELDPSLPRLCAAVHGDAARAFPTFGLALGLLPEPHWDALSPERPLRALALVDLDAHLRSLTHAPLAIDERVLLALVGLDTVDARLAEALDVEPAGAMPLAAGQAAELERAAARWRAGDQRPFALRGGDAAERAAFERALAHATNAERLWRLDAAGLASADHAATADMVRRLDREARLTGAPAVVRFDDADPADLAVARRWARRLAATAPRVVLSSRDPVAGLPASAIVVDLPVASFGERVALWNAALGPVGGRLNGHAERLAGHFRLPSDAVWAAAAEAGDGSDPAGEVASRLWQACRSRARAGLDGLAQCIEPRADWEDLVLPPREVAALRAVLRHTRHRARVHEEWRAEGPGHCGGGVSALFAGPSGTGKSLAAEVIAAELELDLYRVDLSQVVSKYVGETEKHLCRVFDAAERSGAVLVVDEADALFGRRSEVKDSHDRYANIEVSYLLQRMESYCGLAVLTTNLRESIDDAFVRRLGFIVTFPFPDAHHRRELWLRAFGPRVPVAELDVDRLAQLNLSGGSIRNCAVHAAFLAAERSSAVTMDDLLAAARVEYEKLDRPLTTTELEGWAP
jgi:hypothetical protein